MQIKLNFAVFFELLHNGGEWEIVAPSNEYWSSVEFTKNVDLISDLAVNH